MSSYDYFLKRVVRVRFLVRVCVCVQSNSVRYYLRQSEFRVYIVESITIEKRGVNKIREDVELIINNN